MSIDALTLWNAPRPGTGQQTGSLLRGATGGDIEAVRTVRVESQGVDAIHDDLVGELLGEIPQRGFVCGPRYGDDDHVGLRARRVVGRALDHAGDPAVDRGRTRLGALRGHAIR